MRMSVVAVGQKMPTWVREACEEYLKRMPREHPVQLIEVKPASRTDSKYKRTSLRFSNIREKE